MRTVFEDASATIDLLEATEAEEIHRFFADIAAELGWRPPEGGIASFPGQSKYFALRQSERLLGAMKLVVGTRDGTLPIMRTWPELQLDGRTDVANLSLLALDKSVRGTPRAFTPLTAEMVRYCRAHGIAELWAELEPRMVQIYRRFGWPFVIRGELREYWGDPLYPCSMSIEAAVENATTKDPRGPIHAAGRQVLRPV